VIPPAFIEDLLSRVDIVEVVGRYVQLKKGGINLMGLCPFHGEKSPSFSVSPTKQFYYCFGCGASGDAIRFLSEHVGMSFHEAVNDLAQQVGLQVPNDASDEERERAKQQKERRSTLTETLAHAGDYYRVQLRAAPRAIDYLKRRGLTGEIAAHFGLGYAPEGWKSLASAFPRYDDPLLEDSGLVISQGEDEADRKRYDRFRDRIMFPIRSVQGDVIGFGGRVLDKGEPKYLNSPETAVFSKGRELYGLHEARHAMRQRGFALVVEGYMDVVALAQLGFPNAVATLGTACTAEHVQKLFRFTDSVVFSFDGDAAGRRAAGRALEAALPHASDTRTVRFLFLPAEHDPDSYVREHGTQAFEQCIEDSVPLSRQLFEASREGCDMSTAEGRAHFLANAKPLWTALPDGALKGQILGELARGAQLDAGELANLWRGGSASRAGAASSPPEPRPAGPRMNRARPSAVLARGAPAGPADHAMRLLLLHSEWWEHLAPDDQQLLHELPAAHGQLCAWLERRLVENGPEAWAVLASAVQESDLQDFARRLVPPDSLADEIDFGQLRNVLDRLWIDKLKAEETRLIAAAGHDPQALAAYRQVHERRRRLELAPGG